MQENQNSDRLPEAVYTVAPSGAIDQSQETDQGSKLRICARIQELAASLQYDDPSKPPCVHVQKALTTDLLMAIGLMILVVWPIVGFYWDRSLIWYMNWGWIVAVILTFNSGFHGQPLKWPRVFNYYRQARPFFCLSFALAFLAFTVFNYFLILQVLFRCCFDIAGYRLTDYMSRLAQYAIFGTFGLLVVWFSKVAAEKNKHFDQIIKDLQSCI